jgi:phage major head subunit gpT-like protein
MAISEQWAYLLDPGIRQIFEAQRQALAAQSLIPVLFNVQRSNKAVEYDLGIGGMDNFQEYEGRIDYDNPEQLWRPSYEHKEYVKGFKVERKLVDDDMYNVINKRPMAFAMAAMRTREEHAASVFNNAFSTSYNGYDGQPLCDDDHDYSPQKTSSHIDNELVLALSYDNVVTARQTMRAFVDDEGKLISVNPNLLLVPPELENTANEIIKTMRGGNSQQPDTANYTANLLQDRGMNYIVWDYLTDSNAWFLIDTGLSKLYLNWFDRVPLELAMDPTSDFHLEARWRGYMRYSYGWSDFRFIIGCNPS